MSAHDPVTAPFFSARVVDDRVEVAGLPACQLGHRLPSAKGERPDGIFAGWSWDGSRLEVSTDRYGFFPLYYVAGDRHVAVSPSLSTLLALGASRALDDVALAVFLRLGFFLGEDTAFQAIRAVPPDVDFAWRPGALRVYGRLALGKAHGLDRDEAIDAYIALFRRSMEKRAQVGASAAVPLSGGQDSRHILLELAAAGRPPSAAITVRYFAPTRSEESEARALATMVGIPHVVLDQSDSLFDAVERAIAGQNLCSSDHAWILPLADHVRGRFGVLYDGLAGDVLSAGLFLDRERLELFASRRLDALASHLAGPAIPPLPGGPWGRRLDGDVALERLRRELERHADAPNPVGSFFFWNRTRRCIAQSPYQLIRDVPLVFSPYLDHELYDLLAGLPASMLLEHDFHGEAIRRAYPGAASIAYASKPEALPGDAPVMQRFVRQLLAHTVRRGTSRAVRPEYLLPRLMRCLVDRQYAASALWLGRQALYLWAVHDAIERADRC